MSSTVSPLLPTTTLSPANDSLSLPRLLPPTKRQRIMASSQSDLFFHSVARSNHVSHRSFDGLTKSLLESSRVYNMRLASGVSLRTADDSAATDATSVDSDLMNFGTSHFFCAKDSPTGELFDSSESSAASISCIQEAICIMVTSIDNNQENERRIADECFRLAMWTSYRSSSGFHRLEHTQSLTLHEVALIIVSSNGIDAILHAMEEYPSNAQIQEQGCTALGNILSILYPNRAANAASFYQAISKGDTIYSCIIYAMKNHCKDVSVYCAAIQSLQHYYHSIFFSPLYSSVSNSDEQEIFKEAQEMFLPAYIRNVFQQRFS